MKIGVNLAVSNINLGVPNARDLRYTSLPFFLYMIFFTPN